MLPDATVLETPIALHCSKNDMIHAARHIVSNTAPLAGLRILVTRARHQSSQLSEQLKEKGATVIEIPLLEIKPKLSPELEDKIQYIDQYDWIFFASKNAVDTFMQQVSADETVVEKIKRVKIAAIGPATARVLDRWGLKISFHPSDFIAESFVQGFPNYPDLNGVRVLWPRGNLGRDYIARKLNEAGAAIDVVVTYESCLPNDAYESGSKISALIETQALDAIALTSGQTARNLATVLSKFLPERNQLSAFLKDVYIVTIGPETTQAALNSLGKVNIEAEEHTTKGLVAALIKQLPTR